MSGEPPADGASLPDEAPFAVQLSPGAGPGQIAWCDRVLVNDDSVGVLAASYLLSKGLKRLAFVNPTPRHSAFPARGEAFARTAKEGGAIRGDKSKWIDGKFVGQDEVPSGTARPYYSEFGWVAAAICG